MKEGMTSEAAQRICQLLLPSTAAIAVAVTDKDHILGYAGYEEADNPSGSVIRTQPVDDAHIRVSFRHADERGVVAGHPVDRRARRREIQRSAAREVNHLLGSTYSRFRGATYGTLISTSAGQK